MNNNYDKSETDTLLNNKYDKSETDTLLNNKYNKTEADTLLNNKSAHTALAVKACLLGGKTATLNAQSHLLI